MEEFSSKTLYRTRKENVVKYIKNFLKVGLVLTVLFVSAANAGGTTTTSSGSSARPPATDSAKGGWGG
jgi:hypothetical protein